MVPELVDSHCHIPIICAADGAPSASEVVANAAAEGVGHMLCVGVDLETLDGVLDVAARYENVFASVGVHPNTGVEAREPTEADLLDHAARTRVVAIGETGLDYYRNDVPVPQQHERFRTHIRAARETGKPLIIHSRDAGDDLVRILREERADEVGGVMHCFVDTWEVAQATMDLGFMISFSGIVTFKNAREVQEVARRVPLSHLLIETDSPWLAPVPHRGKTNQPAFVRHVGECVADLKDSSIEEIASVTTDNFFRLFSAAVRQS